MKSTTIIISSLIFIGCSKKSFIALSDNNQTKNQIIIKTRYKKIVLKRAGDYIILGNSSAKEIKHIPPNILKEKYKTLYEKIPKKPRSYIVYFNINSLKLTKNSEEILNRALEDMNRSSPCIVDIIGHTDTKGDAKDNMKLSLERAEYIKSLILQRKNFKVLKLTAKGYGESELLIKTLDNVSEPKNRNVEIFIK